MAIEFIRLTFIATLCIKSQGRDFAIVHREIMMYYDWLLRECRDFAELGAGKLAYPLTQVASNACDIVY